MIKRTRRLMILAMEQGAITAEAAEDYEQQMRCDPAEIPEVYREVRAKLQLAALKADQQGLGLEQ